MAWLSVIMVIIEIVKLWIAYRKEEEKDAFNSELGAAVIDAFSTKDVRPLKALRERLRQRRG